jgi:uncharacterized protein YjlB
MLLWLWFITPQLLLIRAMTTCQRQWGKVLKIASPPSSPSLDILHIFMKDDGTFPNNEQYPTLIYKNSFHGNEADGRRLIVSKNEWTEPWVWGIFSYHHYHTKAWELLLCIRGSASIQLGGDAGPTVKIDKGDLVLIPPGVAHKQLKEEGGFSLLGSYPTVGYDGIDTCTSTPTDEERKRIQECYVPKTDPIFNLSIPDLCSSL